MKKQSTKRKAWISAGAVVGFIILAIAIAAAIMESKLNTMLADGQIIKFMLYDLIFVNGWGIILILMGFGYIALILHLHKRHKLHDPKKTFLYSPIPLAILFGLGVALTYDTGDKIKDVVDYYDGKIIQETVQVEHVDHDYVRRFGDSYTYTLTDGREFYEKYDGDNFDTVEDGEYYVFVYLPRTHKMLEIRPVY